MAETITLPGNLSEYEMGILTCFPLEKWIKAEAAIGNCATPYYEIDDVRRDSPRAIELETTLFGLVTVFDFEITEVFSMLPIEKIPNVFVSHLRHPHVFEPKNILKNCKGEKYVVFGDPGQSFSDWLGNGQSPYIVNKLMVQIDSALKFISDHLGFSDHLSDKMIRVVGSKTSPRVNVYPSL